MNHTEMPYKLLISGDFSYTTPTNEPHKNTIWIAHYWGLLQEEDYAITQPFSFHYTFDLICSGSLLHNRCFDFQMVKDVERGAKTNFSNGRFFEIWFFLNFLELFWKKYEIANVILFFKIILKFQIISN